MRIHTNVLLDWRQVHDTLTLEQSRGRIARHVSFKVLDEHGSRTHKRAFEIQLDASERDSGRRAGNSGSYGAMRPEHDGYAATYDEWGWLLAALYLLDPDMVCGTPKYPTYKDATDFHEKTAWTYQPEVLLNVLENGGTDPFPIITGNGHKTKRGYLVGRRGAGRRRSIEQSYWPHAMKPRTIAEVRELLPVKHA